MYARKDFDMLNFILGRSGTGKTFKAINSAIEKRNAGENVIFIVPEQYTLQAERDIIALSKNSVTDIRVLSFKRLAYEVTENKPLHDDISKTMVLFKILKELELSFYNSTNLGSGFLQSLSHTISELYRADIVPEALLNLPISEEMTKLKTEDIAKILVAYRKATENFITTDNALTILYKNIPEIVEDAYIYIDSFNSFSEQEHKIILRLLSYAKEVNICLKTDSIKAPIEGELFYETKMAFSKFKIKDYNYTILTENKRHNNELSQLENSFFEKVKLSEHENIKLFACENFYDEVYQAAHEIKLSVQNKLQYKDIAILAPDEYETAIKIILKEQNIPFFMDKTRKIDTNPLVIFITSIMDVICTSYNKSVFTLLKTGFFNFTDEEIDILENYSLAYGIKGHKWKIAFRNDEVETIRQNFILEMKTFEEIFKNPKAMKVICKQFFEALLLKKDKLQNLTNNRENMTTYKAIISIFENMEAFLGEEIFSSREFYEIMKTGIECSSIGKVPEVMDSVLVGNIERTRTSNIKKLIVLGNHDTTYTGLSLFSEYEKNLLDSYGISLKGANHKLFSAELGFYSAYTKPIESLCITYSKADLHGKSKPLPLIISRLKTILLNELHSSNYVFSEDIAVKSYYFHNFGEFQKKIERFNAQNTHFRLKNTNDIYEKNIKTSVSRLETYVKCPFAYFSTYNLKLKERKFHELNNLEAGNIYHHILKSYFESKNNEENIDEIIENSISKIEIASLEGVCFASRPVDNNIVKFQIERIKKIAKASILALNEQLGDFEIFGSEVPFTGIEIEIEKDRKFILRGTIDRIDVLDADGNKYVKIIDYKSSKKTVKEEDIGSGLQLQLILYLKSLLENDIFKEADKKVLPGGIFYFKIQNPWGETEKNIKDSFKLSGLSKDNPLEYFENLMEVATKRATEIGKEMLSGDISQDPFKNKDFDPCEYCSYKPI